MQNVHCPFMEYLSQQLNQGELLKLKATATFFALVLALGGFAGPANATIVKSTVTLSVPSTLTAGVSSPIDVSVCSLASASTKVCEKTDERNVTLYADGKLVAAVTTHVGVASFYWTPPRPGKVKVSAKVAGKGALKALQSEVQSVTVGKKVLSTSVSTKYCTSEGCGSGAPETIAFDDESASLNVLIGNNAALAKGRDLRLQFINTSNLWATEKTGKSVWDADAKQYGYAFSLTESSETYCDNGDETYDWTFRVLVSGNSKSATAVSGLLEIQYTCQGGGSSSASSLQLDVTFEDQLVDSALELPANLTVSVADPDEIGYSAYSYYCETACSLSDSWIVIDQVDSSGDDEFELSSDWGLGAGTYKVVVWLFPADESDPISSDEWTVEQY